MSTTALSCGNAGHPGLPGDHGARWADVPAEPGRQDVDPLLPERGRVVVHGTDADLAAVVLRLLRKERLATVGVGYAPVTASPAAELWGLPVGAAGLERALTAQLRPVPLVRDDTGGVVVGRGEVPAITGQVYCDDQRVLNGPARRLRVWPDPDAGPVPTPAADPLAVEVEPAEDGIVVSAQRRLRRASTARGRAVQASFETATVLRDGVAQPRPLDRSSWYRHTEDLLLAR